MKAQTVLSLGTVMLLAAVVQADPFVVMDVSSSRTSAYVFDDFGTMIAQNHPMKTGGEQSVDKVIKDNSADNALYFKELLNPLAEYLGTKPTKLFFYGTGGTRNLQWEEEQAVWNNIKKVFDRKNEDNLFNKEFVVAVTETLDGEEEAKIGYELAKKITGDENTLSVAFHGSSVQVATGKDFKSFEGAGVVSASAIFVKSLWDTDEHLGTEGRIDYERKAKAMVDESKEKYDECRKRDPAAEPKKCVDEQKQRDIATLMKAVSQGGELEKYLQKIKNPCLLKESEPMDTIFAFIKTKSLETTLREFVPFKGTGDFYECIDSIADQINQNLPGLPSVRSSKTPFSVVGMGSIFYYEMNLSNFGIKTNVGAVTAGIVDKKEYNKMWTVGGMVKAAKAACKQDYSTNYAEFVVQKKTISGHNLAESCWAMTYLATILKNMGLGHEQAILLTTEHWLYGKAQQIVENKLNI